MLLKRMTIGARVTAGFGALCLLLLALCAFAYLLLMRSDQNFVQYRTLARDSNLTAETEIDLIKARLSLKEFLLTGRDETKSTIERFFHETKTLLTKSEGQITDPERLQLVTRMKEGLASYVRSVMAWPWSA